MKSSYPPEAYSKELLSEAFNWLQNQPESVRELVQTPENLITIYRNEQKKLQKDAPVSSKQFISDLKSLAVGLEAFDDKAQDAKTATQAPPQNMGNLTPTQAPQPPAPKSPTDLAKSQSTFRGPLIQPSNPGKSPMASHDMDPRTRQMVQETRLRLNQSSDSEALRLLVAIGYEKINKI